MGLAFYAQLDDSTDESGRVIRVGSAFHAQLDDSTDESGWFIRVGSAFHAQLDDSTDPSRHGDKSKRLRLRLSPVFSYYFHVFSVVRLL